jgi:hypothetical protein
MTMRKELVGCNGSKALPHETIAYLKSEEHPFRCPLCEAMDKIDDLTHQLSVEKANA